MAHIEYSPSNNKTDEAQGVGLDSKELRFESGGDAMVHFRYKFGFQVNLLKTAVQDRLQQEWNNIDKSLSKTY